LRNQDKALLKRRQQALASAICLSRIGFSFSSALPAPGAISASPERSFLKCEALKFEKAIWKI